MAERAPTPMATARPEARPVDLLSVVIPAKNKAATIVELVERIHEVCDGIAKRCEILVVIPKPDDPTGAAAREAGAEVLVQKRPGYGGAIKEGLAATQGDYVVTLDADLSHPPEAIADLLARRDEAAVVIASRYVAGSRGSQMPARRAFLSQVLNRVYRRILAVPVRDMSSGFRGYQRRVIDELDLESEKFDVLEEILVQSFSLGWDVVEIPFDYQPREGGREGSNLAALATTYLATLFRLWKMRNRFTSADYDSRAYDSLVVPQRYWQRRRFQIVNEMAGATPNRLDLGCGSSRIIQSRPDSIGLDIELPKLRFLRRSNHKLVRASCFALPFPSASFDCVVNSQMIEHVPYERGMFVELNRVLKPGGTLVIGTPDYGRAAWRITEWLYKYLLPYAYADDHITHYTRYSLTEELATTGFATLRYEYILGGELIMQCVKREDCPAAAAAAASKPTA